MAIKRAPLASHALEDIRVDLTPSRDHGTPVEAPGDESALSRSERNLVDFAIADRPSLREPVNLPAVNSMKNRSFFHAPLGDTSAQVAASSILSGFASLQVSGEREKLVPYPVRFLPSQIAKLESLKGRGIVPAEFIRDAVASCLALLDD